MHDTPRISKPGDQTQHDREFEENGARARYVRRELSTMGKAVEGSKLLIGSLLLETKEQKYWVHSHPNFRAYVEMEVGIPYRTAQSLISVVRKCNEAKVPLKLAIQIGWSKVALIAKRLTKQNATDMLSRAERMSYTQLKELAKGHVGRSKQSTSKNGSQADEKPLLLSPTVQEAIRRARLETHDASPGANLDYIALSFLERAGKKFRAEPSRN